MRISLGVLALALAAPGRSASPQEKPTNPAEEFRALVNEAEKAESDFLKATQAAPGGDEDRPLKKPPDFGPRFLELARKYPKGPVALDALVEAVNRGVTVGDESNATVSAALEALLRDHLPSEKLARVCRAVAPDFPQKGAPAFLEAVLENSPHREVRAEACLALAERSRSLAALVEGTRKRPAEAQALARTHGKDFIAALQRQDVEKLRAEASRSDRRFMDNYSGVLPPKRVSWLCFMLAMGTDRAGEAALRGLLGKDLRPEVQGAAALFLARQLKARADELPEAGGREAARLRAESEQLLERVIARHGDVALEHFGTVPSRS